MGWLPKYAPPFGIAQQIVTADYTLTTSEADVTGASITVPKAGTYFAHFSADCDIATGDTFVNIVLNVNGSNVGGSLWGKRGGAHQATSTVAAMWKITTTAANQVVKIRASKVGGGTSKIMATHSVLTIEGPLAAALPS